jgi:hypothetical protein
MKQVLNIGTAVLPVGQITTLFNGSRQKHFANGCRMEFQHITRDTTFDLLFKVNSKHLDPWNP